MIGRHHIGTSISNAVVRRGNAFAAQYRAIRWAAVQLNACGEVNLMDKAAPVILSLQYQERLRAALPPHTVRGMFHHIIEID